MHIFTSIPYRLPDCGHSFCLSCLQDWFKKIQARFVQAHPGWNLDAVKAHVTRIKEILRPEYIHHPDVQNHLKELQPAQPVYTCPKCSKHVLKRPVEDYTLKSVVRGILAASKTEKGAISKGEPIFENGKEHLVAVDPWEGYFPKELL